MEGFIGANSNFDEDLKICMELLNTSKDTALRELSLLQEKGIIKRNGKGKNIYYKLA
jgi:DNA-binding transcriptional ArsR family regulator